MYFHCNCLPKTGIKLFIDQGGYVHLEPPIIILTVVVSIVVVVDIAAI
jgi:hypothetical protein